MSYKSSPPFAPRHRRARSAKSRAARSPKTELRNSCWSTMTCKWLQEGKDQNAFGYLCESNPNSIYIIINIM